MLDWDRFERDGFLVLGSVCEPALLEALQQRIDDIMLQRVVYADLYMQVCPSSSGSWTASGELGHPSTLAYRKIMGLEADELFREYMTLPLFQEAAMKACGPEIAIVRAMFFNKPKEQGKVIDWHQDREGPNNLPPLRPGDGNITIWTALDPCPRESGCLQVIRGSHRRGAIPFGPTSADEPTLSPEQLLEYAPETERVELAMEPGEAVLLHNMLLHKSDVNHTGKPRRAFSAWLTSHRPGTEHWATLWPEYRPNSKGEAQGRNGRPELVPEDPLCMIMQKL